MKIKKRVLCDDRIRNIQGGFSFIPHRFLRDGFLVSLKPDELLLYFLLILVADRQGLSYYSQDRLCNLVRMQLGDFIDARNGLIQKDLIAFDGFMFQVLSLPKKPLGNKPKLLTKQQDFEQADPATIRQLIQQSFLENER
jgi:hypothetical protein